MNDIMKKASAMEAYLSVIEEPEFKIKRDFDPRGMSHENWKKIVWPVTKLFIEDMTADNFREILEEHRNLWTKRDEKRLSLEKHPPDLFRYMSNRIFPLEEKRYKNARASLSKRTKIVNAVLLFHENKLKLMGDSDADEIIKEKSKKSEASAEDNSQ